MDTSSDELAIRQLCANYIDAVNRRDEAAWTGTWASDASWALMGMEVQGREQIFALWQNAMASFRHVFMMQGSGTIEVSGDQGCGRWYLTEHLVQQDGGASMALGVYDDRYRREDGHWVFSTRRYQVLYRGASSLDGDWQSYQP